MDSIRIVDLQKGVERQRCRICRWMAFCDLQDGEKWRLYLKPFSCYSSKRHTHRNKHMHTHTHTYTHTHAHTHTHTNTHTSTHTHRHTRTHNTPHTNKADQSDDLTRKYSISTCLTAESGSCDLKEAKTSSLQGKSRRKKSPGESVAFAFRFVLRPNII